MGEREQSEMQPAMVHWPLNDTELDVALQLDEAQLMPLEPEDAERYTLDVIKQLDPWIPFSKSEDQDDGNELIMTRKEFPELFDTLQEDKLKEIYIWSDKVRQLSISLTDVNGDQTNYLFEADLDPSVEQFDHEDDDNPEADEAEIGLMNYRDYARVCDIVNLAKRSPKPGQG